MGGNVNVMLLVKIIGLYLTFQPLAVISSTVRFNMKKFYVLPTQGNYVFRMYLSTNSEFALYNRK